jgi:Fuc2NAc and GlcNAc transferase
MAPAQHRPARFIFVPEAALRLLGSMAGGASRGNVSSSRWKSLLPPVSRRHVSSRPHSVMNEQSEVFIHAVLAAAAICAISFALTYAIKGYAVNRCLMDLPNHRSSHVVPMPRGGGLAIVLSVCATIASLTVLDLLDPGVSAALLGGGVLMAVIGWVDDHKGLAPSLRMLMHAAAAAWAIVLLGGLDGVMIGPLQLPLPVIGSLIALPGVVWAVNLFNFMDGIDGIAGMESLWLGLVGGCLFLLGGEPGMGYLCLAVAAASAGFLFWNFPPAKIFMGDVGSTFLGFCFAALAIVGELTGAVPILLWAILAGTFIFDATATLLRRAWRGDRLSQAHRTHAYQRAVQSGWSHRRVVAGVALLNAALGLLAFGGWLWPALAPIAAALACLVLSAAYLAVERRQPMWDGGCDAPPRIPTGASGAEL